MKFLSALGFGDLLNLLKPLNVNTYHAKELMSELLIIVKSKNDIDKQQDISNFLKQHLSSTATDKKSLIDYYFLQLFSTKGFFLDLRTLESEKKRYWYQFTEDFRLSLIKLYDSYFQQDMSGFEQALVATGLIDKEWSQERKEELKNLFKMHFSNSFQENTQIQFKIEDFIKSFTQIFSFYQKMKAKIPTPFVILGINLTTLYMEAEKNATMASPKETFNRAKSSVK
jgi:hypothetical protein